MTATEQALERAARVLHASARSHKKMERWHRDRVREEMAALEAAQATLKSLGIELVLEPQGEAEVTHGQECEGGRKLAG